MGNLLRWGEGLSLESLVFWVVERVSEFGYTGIFVMMFVESSFVPFPSEVSMIPAGYLASQGEMNPVLATLAGAFGSIGGAWVNYWLAITLGRTAIERLGRYFFITPEQLDRAETYFATHGDVTTFVGRLIPGIRQIISIPAGLARMSFWRFTLFTGVGAGIWCAILVAVGYVAGASEEIWRPLLQKITGGLFAGLVILVIGYLIWHRKRAAAS